MTVYYRNILETFHKDDGHKFQLKSDFIITHTKYGTLAIPAGFWTDYASVPKIFHAIISPVGRTRRAAVLHDWLYYSQKYNNKPILRREADKIFYDALVNCIPKEARINRFIAWNMYQAVKFCGYKAWNKNKKDRSKNED